MSWCFADEASPYGDLVLDSLQRDSAIVPSLWPLEVANVLLIAERRQRVTQVQTTQALSLLRALPIEVDLMTAEYAMADTLHLGRVHALSAYDAAYLELAIRLGLPIATTDGRLLLAADACGVSQYLTPEG